MKSDCMVAVLLQLDSLPKIAATLSIAAGQRFLGSRPLRYVVASRLHQHRWAPAQYLCAAGHDAAAGASCDTGHHALHLWNA